MQGSINFDGSLIGNITGGGGGGGSEVVITPVLTSGTKIADVTVDGEDKDLFAPTPTPPTPATEVRVTQTLASGTKIGSIEVDGESTDLYAPHQSAANTSYDNTISGFIADNVQEAIDEISGITGDGQLDIGDDLTDAVNKIKQSLSDLTTLTKTASGAIVTFDDGSDLPMPSLKVSIEPVQSGSGDPSPTNIRPISGWDEVNVTVANAVSDPTVSNTYAIDLDGTRYGGTLDVISGVLTIDRASVDLDTLYWSYSTADVRFFTTSIKDIKKVMDPKIVMNGLCSHYDIVAYQYVHKSTALDGVMGLFSTSTTNYLAIKDTRYTDVTSFKTAMNGVQLVYELATPLTIQLTPTQVKSLLGVNNIWADTGDIELTYLTNNPLTQTVYDMVKILVEQS